MRHVFLCLILVFSLVSCKKKISSNVQTPSCYKEGYYVDSLNGNDLNTGTSSCFPWKTLSKIKDINLSSGGDIFLKRGSVFYESFEIPNSNITISAYSNGPDPIFDGREFVSSWTDEGGNIYSYTSTTSEGLGNIAKGDQMLKFVAWNGDHINTLSVASNNSYTFNHLTKTIYIKSDQTPDSKNYKASRLYTGISANGLSDIKISNVKIVGFSLHGINFKNCIRCQATHLEVVNIGGARLGVTYAGNGIEYGNSSQQGLVSDVKISEVFDSCLSPQTYTSNQVLTAMTFKDSSLTKCGFAGVEISVLSNGGTSGSSISNITLKNIVITDSGKGFSGRRYMTEGHGVRIGVDAGAGVLNNTTLSQIKIQRSAGVGVKIFGNTATTTISRTWIDQGEQEGILFSDAGASVSKLKLSASILSNNTGYGLSFNCPACAGFEVFHTTFVNNGSINFAVFGHAGDAISKNNVFSSSSAVTHFYSSNTLFSPSINFNCYDTQNLMFGYNAAAYSNLVTYRAATGLDWASLESVAIGFIDTSQKNFQLASNSICINSGSGEVNIFQDYNGNDFAQIPSAGAYQY